MLSLPKIISLSTKYNVIPLFKEFSADFETPLSIFLKTKAQFFLESVENIQYLGRYSIIASGKKKEFIIENDQLIIKDYFGEKYISSPQVQTHSFPFEQVGREEKLDQSAYTPIEFIQNYFKRIHSYQEKKFPPFFGGVIGYLGYETIRYYESIPSASDLSTIGAGNRSQSLVVPDGVLVIPHTTIIYDNLQRKFTLITVIVSPELESGEVSLAKQYLHNLETIQKIEEQLATPLKIPLEPLLEDSLAKKETINTTGNYSLFEGIDSNFQRQEFLSAVQKCKDYISEGEAIQIVLSQQFSTKTLANSFDIYRILRRLNPSPYLYYLDFEDFKIIGSSPEVMVKVEQDQVLLKPIAGTRQRGSSDLEDEKLAKELLADEKECAEHLMLVDLGRNDLSRIAKTGTVKVTDYMVIEKYSHVQHIVSTVTAQKKEKYDAFDVIKATFPAGTLSGAPKIRAMEIIAQLEKSKRGIYGGMIFCLSYNGNLNSCIAIRTIIKKGQRVFVQAGCGVVVDSSPVAEYQETINKAQAPLLAIKMANSNF